MKPAPPIKKPEVKKPDPKPVKPVIKPKILKEASLVYLTDVDAALMDLTTALKTIAKPFFEDDITRVNHPLFSVDMLGKSPKAKDFEIRFMKMLQICYFTHHYAIESLVS